MVSRGRTIGGELAVGEVVDRHVRTEEAEGGRLLPTARGEQQDVLPGDEFGGPQVAVGDHLQRVDVDLFPGQLCFRHKGRRNVRLAALRVSIHGNRTSRESG